MVFRLFYRAAAEKATAIWLRAGIVLKVSIQYIIESSRRLIKEVTNAIRIQRKDSKG